MTNKKLSNKKHGTINLVLLSIITFVMMISLSSAYPLGLPAINLWDFLIGTVFGSFWIAILTMIFVMFIILALGGISAWTNLTYQGLFVLAMSIGYGQAIVTVPLWAMLMSWAVYQITQWVNSRY